MTKKQMVTVAAKVDIDTKYQARAILEGFGIRIGTAVSMFLHACVRTKSLAISKRGLVGPARVWVALSDAEGRQVRVFPVAAEGEVDESLLGLGEGQGWRMAVFYDRDSAQSWASSDRFERASIRPYDARLRYASDLLVRAHGACPASLLEEDECVVSQERCEACTYPAAECWYAQLTLGGIGEGQEGL